MKTKLINELNMFFALKSHMEKNQQLWASVKEIGNALKKFNSNILEMTDLKDSSEVDLVGLMNKKEQQRIALINEGNPVLNILKVYAKDTKDKSLLKKLNSLKKSFSELKDIRLLEYFKLIWKQSRRLYNKALSGEEKSKSKVQEHNSILNYGLSGKMVDNIEEENQNFENSYLAYSEAKLQKRKDIIQFESLCKKNHRILKNKVDLLVSIFEKTNADFYHKYNSLRVVVKEEKAKKEKKPVKAEIKTVAATKTTPISNENKQNKVIPPIAVTKKIVPVKKIQRTSSPKTTGRAAPKGTNVTKTAPKSRTTRVIKKPPIKKPTQPVSGTEKAEN